VQYSLFRRRYNPFALQALNSASDPIHLSHNTVFWSSDSHANKAFLDLLRVYSTFTTCSLNCSIEPGVEKSHEQREMNSLWLGSLSLTARPVDASSRTCLFAGLTMCHHTWSCRTLQNSNDFVIELSFLDWTSWSNAWINSDKHQTTSLGISWPWAQAFARLLNRTRLPGGPVNINRSRLQHATT